MKFAISFILLLVVFFLTNAQACLAPMTGEKYNKQIEVTSTDIDGVYEFVIPLKMEGLDDLDVSLNYAPKHVNDVSKYAPYDSLKIEIEGNNAIGTLTVEKNENWMPYLRAIWRPSFPTLCSVIAISDFIGISNANQRTQAKDL